MLRLKDAWDVAVRLKERRFWLALAGKALEQLDIGMAVRVYRALKDAAYLLFDQAKMVEGELPLDISLFNKRLSKFMGLALK